LLIAYLELTVYDLHQSQISNRKSIFMLIKRKEFLQLGSFATASLLVPKFLKALETGKVVPAGNKVVVILQLSGGNDGLNTVIPVRNDIYYKVRPRLGITKDKALPTANKKKGKRGR